MFTSEKAKVFKQRLKSQIQKGAPYWGVCRRATNLLPFPANDNDVLLKDAYISGYTNLLLALEANQTSGCLIIQSEKQKSRSGILIFRGRILGCMYGQKNLKNYLFDEQAYERALQDLQGNVKTVDAYNVKDEIVIASASLFHGPAFEEPQLPAHEFFDTVYSRLVDANMPGCIVISNPTEDASVIVYIFAGAIVGIYSSKKGWVKPELGFVYKELQKSKNLRVRACVMPCRNVGEVNQYTFSLSGLGDREFRRAPQAGKYDILNIFYLLRMDDARIEQTKEHKVVRFDKFTPAFKTPQERLMSRLSNLSEINEGFAVRP